jgi:hypothetical protein
MINMLSDLRAVRGPGIPRLLAPAGAVTGLASAVVTADQLAPTPSACLPTAEVMYVGMDVYGRNKMSNVMGTVGFASTIGSNDSSKYWGQVRTNSLIYIWNLEFLNTNKKMFFFIQAGKLEPETLKDFMSKGLSVWADNNGQTFPKHVVMFRDGVSDESEAVDVIKEQEGGKMLQAIQEIAKGTTSFTFIIKKPKLNVRAYLRKLRSNRQVSII